MLKKILSLTVLAGVLSSCAAVDSFNKMQNHWGKMDMDAEVPNKVCDPSSVDMADIRFCVANDPDLDASMDGEDFGDEYNELIKFLSYKGFTIVDKAKQADAAMVIAKPTKERPNYKYIAVDMELNARQEETKYRVVYGGNKKSAQDLFSEYKKALG